MAGSSRRRWRGLHFFSRRAVKRALGFFVGQRRGEGVYGQTRAAAEGCRFQRRVETSSRVPCHPRAVGTTKAASWTRLSVRIRIPGRASSPPTLARMKPLSVGNQTSAARGPPRRRRPPRGTGRSPRGITSGWQGDPQGGGHAAGRGVVAGPASCGRRPRRETPSPAPPERRPGEADQGTERFPLHRPTLRTAAACRVTWPEIAAPGARMAPSSATPRAARPPWAYRNQGDGRMPTFDSGSCPADASVAPGHIATALWRAHHADALQRRPRRLCYYMDLLGVSRRNDEARGTGRRGGRR